MSYLIDTNVISETFRTKPSLQVEEWFNSIPGEELFISVLTLGEIRKGVEKLPSGKKKNELIIWLEHHLISWFGTHILDITSPIADKWGYISAITSPPIPAIDGLIAATALTHSLKLVTRNIKDFKSINGLELINPFA